MKKAIALLFVAAALVGCQKNSDTGTVSSATDTNMTTTPPSSVNTPAASATNTSVGQTPSTAPNTKSGQSQ